MGIGDWSAPATFDAFGEPTDNRIRAEMLDEALGIITRLWSGEMVEHHGNHYDVGGYALTATPAQRPRIPIWVGGDSGAALRRAARWDGWIGPDEDPLGATPADAANAVRRLQKAGASMENFDLAWSGRSKPADSEMVAAYQDAGATWWIEILLGSAEEGLARVVAGPPH